LTDLERNILYWVASGATVGQVATALRLENEYIVKTRLRAMFVKLGADNSAHMVMLAVQAGWIDPVTGKVRSRPVPPADLADAMRDLTRQCYVQAAKDLRKAQGAVDSAIADFIAETRN
jgi:DNA-binding CsgD family transcriptional regulator